MKEFQGAANSSCNKSSEILLTVVRAVRNAPLDSAKVAGIVHPDRLPMRIHPVSAPSLTRWLILAAGDGTDCVRVILALLF